MVRWSVVLATQGWQKAVEEEDDLAAVDRLSVPLNAASIQVDEIHAEYCALLHCS